MEAHLDSKERNDYFDDSYHLDHLDRLESLSIYIFREMFRTMKRPAMLWSFGKDSTVMIYLARKAFFGQIPFPLIHCDTELEMEEVYEYRDRYVDEWKLNFIKEICPPIESTDPTLPHAARIAARKTEGLKNVLAKYKYDSLATGIRRDEEGTRAKERYFSPRSRDGQWDPKDQPPEFWNQFLTEFPPGTHVRVHPLLHWSELNIWEYIERENIPTVPLYFAKQYPEYDNQWMRFRSIGEKGITFPIKSKASNLDQVIQELKVTKISERSGRPMGKDEDESSFERLRADGYL